MLIKIVLIISVLLIAYYLVHSTAKATNVALRRLLLLAFVIIAIVTIIFPEITGYVANFLGVGRGSDLLLYMLVIAFLSYAVVNYRRLNILEGRLVELARELAISRTSTPITYPQSSTSQEPPSSTLGTNTELSSDHNDEFMTTSVADNSDDNGSES